MNDDEQIQSLLNQIRGPEPPDPLARRKALSRLLPWIQRSPRLRRDAHQDYAHALSLTLEWVSKNIDQFQPRSDSVSEDLMKWVNGHLTWRIGDLRNPNESPKELYQPDKEHQKIAKKFGILPLDQSWVGKDGQQTAVGEVTADARSKDLSLLDRWIQELQQAEQQRAGVQIQQYLEGDPDGILQSCHPGKFPACHAQMLVRRLHLSDPPDTVRAIAQDVGIPEQTLYSHWRSKCLPLLQIVALRFDPQVVEVVRSDSEPCLGECHPPDRPECNCLDVAKRLLLSHPPEPMAAIAKTLKITESALAKHWQTQCLPRLKKYRLRSP